MKDEIVGVKGVMTMLISIRRLPRLDLDVLGAATQGLWLRQRVTAIPIHLARRHTDICSTSARYKGKL